MNRRIIIPYNPKLKGLAKNIRKNMTLSEVLLWQELKGK
jgi:very-short-patch-repair endonuclease